MLHEDAVDNLLLNSVVSPLELGEAIRLNDTSAPFPHRRCALIFNASLHAFLLQLRALRERHKLRVVVGHREVEDPETLKVALVRRRLDHAVDGRLVIASSEHLHRVADVDNLEQRCFSTAYSTYHECTHTYQCIIDMTDPSPLAIRGHNLESRDWLAPQDGDSSNIWCPGVSSHHDG